MSTESPQETQYRWIVLALSVLTNALVVAMPSMCLTVLFDEIAADLNLTLTQVGVVWGIGALPGVVTMLLGGALGDRLGPKRILMAASLLAGVAGMLRGLAGSFEGLVVSVFLFGFISPVVPMNVLKSNGNWFSQRQLGLANGVVSMGMALGFLAGSLISATVLSPLLGGWRPVLILYGALAMALSIPWALTRPGPATGPAVSAASPLPIFSAIRHVAGVRNMWLLGWAILFIGGGIQAMLGYLPLYLRGVGWMPASADGAASLFHLVSLIAAIPIALASDRLGSRKRIVLLAALMIAAGIGLLSVTAGALVLVAVVIAGVVRDGFMAVLLTWVVESPGVGALYAGTATGFVMVFSSLGSLLAPPLGNSLAALAPGLPFLFWSALALVGIGGLAAAREMRHPPF